MKYERRKGFTLVELIVVITIVAILSTFGFVAYVDYLKGVRDSNRIQQMTEIQKALTLYGVKSNMPNPQNGLNVVSGSSAIGVQGYANQTTLDTIKYSNGGVDPKTKKFYTYFVSADRKYAQILGYFEENNTIELYNTQNNSSPGISSEYSILTPGVVGDELGTIIQEGTQYPIQDLQEYSESGVFDIFSASGSFISYVNNSQVSIGSGISLIGMVPRITCKKILDTFGTSPSGLYKINPNGAGQVEVYCEMDQNIDGGGWTYVAHIDNDTIGNNVYFNAPMGEYTSSRTDTNSTYGLNMFDFYHGEMIVTYDQPDIVSASNNNKFLQLSYDVGIPGFNMGPLMPGCPPNNQLDIGDGFSFKTSLSESYNFSTTTQCHSGYWSLRPTPHNGIYLVAFRDVLSGDGEGGGARYDSRAYGIQSGEPGYDVSWSHDAYIYVR